jgi:hypothetical protein
LFAERFMARRETAGDCVWNRYGQLSGFAPQWRIACHPKSDRRSISQQALQNPKRMSRAAMTSSGQMLDTATLHETSAHPVETIDGVLRGCVLKMPSAALKFWSTPRHSQSRTPY